MSTAKSVEGATATGRSSTGLSPEHFIAGDPTATRPTVPASLPPKAHDHEGFSDPGLRPPRHGPPSQLHAGTPPPAPEGPPPPAFLQQTYCPLGPAATQALNGYLACPSQLGSTEPLGALLDAEVHKLGASGLRVGVRAVGGFARGILRGSGGPRPADFDVVFVVPNVEALATLREALGVPPTGEMTYFNYKRDDLDFTGSCADATYRQHRVGRDVALKLERDQEGWHATGVWMRTAEFPNEAGDPERMLAALLHRLRWGVVDTVSCEGLPDRSGLLMLGSAPGTALGTHLGDPEIQRRLLLRLVAREGRPGQLTALLLRTADNHRQPMLPHVLAAHCLRLLGEPGVSDADQEGLRTLVRTCVPAFNSGLVDHLAARIGTVSPEDAASMMGHIAHATGPHARHDVPLEPAYWTRTLLGALQPAAALAFAVSRERARPLLPYLLDLSQERLPQAWLASAWTLTSVDTTDALACLNSRGRPAFPAHVTAALALRLVRMPARDLRGVSAAVARVVAWARGSVREGSGALEQLEDAVLAAHGADGPFPEIIGRLGRELRGVLGAGHPTLRRAQLARTVGHGRVPPVARQDAFRALVAEAPALAFDLARRPGRETLEILCGEGGVVRGLYATLARAQRDAAWEALVLPFLDRNTPEAAAGVLAEWLPTTRTDRAAFLEGKIVSCPARSSQARGVLVEALLRCRVPSETSPVTPGVVQLLTMPPYERIHAALSAGLSGRLPASLHGAVLALPSDAEVGAIFARDRGALWSPGDPGAGAVRAFGIRWHEDAQGIREALGTAPLEAFRVTLAGLQDAAPRRFRQLFVSYVDRVLAAPQPDEAAWALVGAGLDAGFVPPRGDEAADLVRRWTDAYPALGHAEHAAGPRLAAWALARDVGPEGLVPLNAHLDPAGRLAAWARALQDAQWDAARDLVRDPVAQLTGLDPTTGIACLSPPHDLPDDLRAGVAVALLLSPERGAAVDAALAHALEQAPDAVGQVLFDYQDRWFAPDAVGPLMDSLRDSDGPDPLEPLRTALSRTEAGTRAELLAVYRGFELGDPSVTDWLASLSHSRLFRLAWQVDTDAAEAMLRTHLAREGAAPEGVRDEILAGLHAPVAAARGTCVTLRARMIPVWRRAHPEARETQAFHQRLTALQLADAADDDARDTVISEHLTSADAAAVEASCRRRMTAGDWRGAALRVAALPVGTLSWADLAKLSTTRRRQAFRAFVQAWWESGASAADRVAACEAAELAEFNPESHTGAARFIAEVAARAVYKKTVGTPAMPPLQTCLAAASRVLTDTQWARLSEGHAESDARAWRYASAVRALKACSRVPERWNGDRLTAADLRKLDALRVGTDKAPAAWQGALADAWSARPDMGTAGADLWLAAIRARNPDARPRVLTTLRVQAVLEAAAPRALVAVLQDTAMLKWWFAPMSEADRSAVMVTFLRRMASARPSLESLMQLLTTVPLQTYPDDVAVHVPQAVKERVKAGSRRVYYRALADCPALGEALRLELRQTLGKARRMPLPAASDMVLCVPSALPMGTLDWEENLWLTVQMAEGKSQRAAAAERFVRLASHIAGTRTEIQGVPAASIAAAVLRVESHLPTETTVVLSRWAIVAMHREVRLDRTDLPPHFMDTLASALQPLPPPKETKGTADAAASKVPSLARVAGRAVLRAWELPPCKVPAGKAGRKGRGGAASSQAAKLRAWGRGPAKSEVGPEVWRQVRAELFGERFSIFPPEDGAWAWSERADAALYRELEGLEAGTGAWLDAHIFQVATEGETLPEPAVASPTFLRGGHHWRYLCEAYARRCRAWKAKPGATDNELFQIEGRLS